MGGGASACAQSVRSRRWRGSAGSGEPRAGRSTASDSARAVARGWQACPDLSLPVATCVCRRHLAVLMGSIAPRALRLSSDGWSSRLASQAPEGFGARGGGFSRPPKPGLASVPQRMGGSRPPRVSRSSFRPGLAGRLAGQICVPLSASTASFRPGLAGRLAGQICTPLSASTASSPDDVSRSRSFPPASVGCHGVFVSPERVLGRPAAEASSRRCRFVAGAAALPPAGREARGDYEGVSVFACPGLPRLAGERAIQRPEPCRTLPRPPWRGLAASACDSRFLKKDFVTPLRRFEVNLRTIRHRTQGCGLWCS